MTLSAGPWTFKNWHACVKLTSYFLEKIQAVNKPNFYETEN
jgi:hypothetical protein